MAWAGGAAGPLPGGLTGIWELWEKGQEGLPARCPQQSRPQGPSVAAGTGAAKGKAGLERARASRGSGVCASPLPPPIHVPGGVLALAKGSPTPSSAQNWVGGAAGAGTNAVISPFIYQNSSHLETHSPGRHHRGREPPPPSWSTHQALHKGRAPWWQDRQFWGVGPGWARRGASRHAGPFPEPGCSQKPQLIWSCCQAVPGRGNRPDSAAAAAMGESQATAPASPGSLFTAGVFWPGQLLWQAQVSSSRRHAEAICFCKSLGAGNVLGRLLPTSRSAATQGSPHVGRAASRPGSLQKPGSEGRAALQNPDTWVEATWESGGRREGEAGTERFGMKLVKRKLHPHRPNGCVYLWEPSNPGCRRAAG